jgi:hypothetical protein
MKAHLTNEKNPALGWKGSSNRHRRHRYSIIVFIILNIGVIVLALVHTFANVRLTLRYFLITSINFPFVIINEQEQKRPDNKIRHCVLVHE